MAFLLQFCQASVFLSCHVFLSGFIGSLDGSSDLFFSLSKKTVVIRSFIGSPSLTICHLVAFCFVLF